MAAVAPAPTPVVDLAVPTADAVDGSAPARAAGDVPSTPWWVRRVPLLLCLLAVGGALVAGSRLADAQGWIDASEVVARAGALVGTWAGIVLLARRCGGRVVVIGGFAAALLGLVAAFPDDWAVAGAAAAAACAYGLLGMVLTRPAQGARALGELLLSAAVGMLGALIVSGYDVVLRPYRFRTLVLGVVLVAALALAWRLGHGRRSIGRRGAFVIVTGVAILALSVAYAQAIRSWGSPGLVATISDVDGWITATFGASPRPVEMLVGFPALLWGVAFRRRNRQGWWMCAFGALGAAGVTSSLIQDSSLGDNLQATAYSLLIGAVIGVVLIAMDRALTSGGRRSGSAESASVERSEPARFEALL